MVSLRAGTAAVVLGCAFAEDVQENQNPIQRVVGLLKDMAATLNKDMEEDEALYDKLRCWCRTNRLEKGDSSKASEDKIAELQAAIESGTASAKQLTEDIASLEETLNEDTNALKEAENLRNKQLKEFQASEGASIVAIENCKGAITVLEKHAAAAFPQLKVSLLQDWNDDRTSSDFGQFLSDEGVFDHVGGDAVAKKHLRAMPEQLKPDAPVNGWASNDVDIVRRALKSAAAFVQARGGGALPSYGTQSGEILGVLRQMLEDMSGQLKADQQEEAERVESFTDMSATKKRAIADADKMSKRKEEELATTKNDLTEAKLDLKSEGYALGDIQKFSKNMEKNCAEADENFLARKKERMNEIGAVSQTIEILTSDDARDAARGTYSFVQRSAQSSVRKLAAAKLRRAAAVSGDPAVALLASSVELDAFTEVKKAIDDMIAELKVQQADEVKKRDYCKENLHEAQVNMERADEEKNDLLAKEEGLKAKIKDLEDGIQEANNNIESTMVSLKRAGEDRQMENREFQNTQRDQKVTAEVLKKALKKLEKFYGFVQATPGTPPVEQMTYEKSSGAAGVMQMIESLIKEAKKMADDSLAEENEAQFNYETLIIDSTNTMKSLGKKVLEKKNTLVKTKAELGATQQDIADSVKEMGGIADLQTSLHSECDYLLNNFDLRQSARITEMDALAEAKAILSGAAR